MPSFCDLWSRLYDVIPGWLKPNKLTALRGLLVIPLVILFQVDHFGRLLSCAAILLIMAVTDLLDGLLARKYRIAHREGELIDSMADGIVRFTVFLLFYDARLVALWPVLVIIWRDLFSWTLRFMDLARGNYQVNKRISGKINCAVQSLSIALIMGVIVLAAGTSTVPRHDLIFWSIVAAMGTSVWSLVDLLATHRTILKLFWKQKLD